MRHRHFSKTNKVSNRDIAPHFITLLKVKNVHNFAIFQPICLKLGMKTLNGKTYSFSELIGLAIFWSWRSYGIGDL